MHRSVIFAFIAAIALALAACAGPGSAMPESVVTRVSPSELTLSTASFVIEGANFFQYVNGAGTQIEFCGVTVDGVIVDPVRRALTLAPAGRVMIEAGERVTVTVPSRGVQFGLSDVRVLRPDGTVTVVADAVTCLAAPTDLEPGPTEPRPIEPEPTEPDPTEPGPTEPDLPAETNRTPIAGITLATQGFEEGSRVLRYESTSIDPDEDDLSYDWKAWGIDSLYSDEAPAWVDLVGEATGSEVVLVRPEIDLHYLQLTVTDPHGASDTVLYATILDPLGDVMYWDSDHEGGIDIVRASWTVDARAKTTNFEIEAAATFSLVSPEESWCRYGDVVPFSSTESPSRGAGVTPQNQPDATPILGTILFLPGVDLETFEGLGEPTLAMELGAPLDDGSWVLFDPNETWSCDRRRARALVSPSVEGAVLKFAVPSSIVGFDSLMMGWVGNGEGPEDIFPGGAGGPG